MDNIRKMTQFLKTLVSIARKEAVRKNPKDCTLDVIVSASGKWQLDSERDTCYQKKGIQKGATGIFIEIRKP